MGGYGALFLAGSVRARFCAAGGHSAALWTSPGSTAPGAFDDAADFETHDVFQLAARGAYRRLQVWLDVGTRDPFRSADTALAKRLRRDRVRVTFHVWPGGHESSYWKSHMRAYLRFYAKALAACRVT